MTVDEGVKLAMELIRQSEGLRLKPYLCPADVPTIGYGSTRYADGKPVTLKDQPITREQAEELLKVTLLRDYLPGVLKASPSLQDKPKALAAILDFAYNLGVSAYSNSTLRKRVDAGDWGSVILELRRWVKANGKVLPGLVNRRNAEIKLIQSEVKKA